MKTLLLGITLTAAVLAQAAEWKVGEPIVTYWCGPAMTDAVAEQMAEGGFNLVWCNEQTLAVAQRHKLRAMLQDGLISPASLENPDQRKRLDELIDRVKNHPALYAYYLTDEPNAAQFPALGRLVAYLRERDPGHLAYINLFPTYANNEQLGNKGDLITAYREHLTQYVENVKPDLISFDHYQFSLQGDRDQYFLNLAMIRRAANKAGLPFLNIVQACTWAPTVMRVPTADEVRYLAYTTAAYGAQGLSYYIYTCANHVGGLAKADGTPTPLYQAAKSFNREFVNIARELQPLRSLAVWHTTMRERGCEAPPVDLPFKLGSVEQTDKTRGYLLGCLGANEPMTHILIVNLDYRAQAKATPMGAGRMQSFNARTGEWSDFDPGMTSLEFPPGGGVLLRLIRK